MMMFVEWFLLTGLVSWIVIWSLGDSIDWNSWPFTKPEEPKLYHVMVSDGMGEPFSVYESDDWYETYNYLIGFRGQYLSGNESAAWMTFKGESVRDL